MCSFRKPEREYFSEDLYRLFRCLSRRHKRQLFLLFLLQVTSASLEVISLGSILPFLYALTNVSALMENAYVAVLLDIVGVTSPNQVIMLMAGLFGITVVIANIFRSITLWVQHYLSAAIATDMSVRLFKNILCQQYSFFLHNNSSNLIGMLTEDLRGAIGVIQETLAMATHVPIILFIIIGLLNYNTSVTLVLSIILITVYIVISLIIKKTLFLNGKKTSDNFRKIIKVLQESFGGIRYLALDGTHSTFIDQYTKADTIFRRSLAYNNVLGKLPKFLIEAIGMITISMVAIVFAGQGKSITSLVPLLGLFATAAIRLLPACQQIYASVSGLLGSRIALNRVIKMLSGPLSPPLLSSTNQSFEFTNSLIFRDVWFSYQEKSSGKQSNDWTLKGLNFSIRPKTTVAFVGHTGSGKSTIADLILGLLTLQKGRIEVDGSSLEGEHLKFWQSSIAHVPQNIFLADLSIAENIAFGVKTELIDRQCVLDAAKDAKIDQFIKELPNQYDQLVGEQGIRLSGGQRQRIGIARALYKRPSLLIFDEATSALDYNTEKEVMKAIDELGQKITIILIAHRLSTVQRADRILLLKKGRIIAQGSYKELLETSEAFNALIHGTV